ncbi:MAG: hypothetical protein DRN20_01475 [Thermoplasmata archaeon]|nr:MAG: hypothetical protein DRN20_01475 [Thermoplasmata archaeon]
MKKCPVCGENNPEESVKCSRCGYVFGEEIYGDSRDDVLKKKIENFKKYREKLKQNFSIYFSYFEDIDSGLSEAEFAALLSNALSLLSLPLKLSLDMRVDFSTEETKLIKIMDARVEEMETERGWQSLPVQVYVRLGNAFFFMQNMDKALKYYDRALLVSPKYDIALKNKSLLLFKMGEYKKAMKILDKIGVEDSEVRALKQLILQLIDKSPSP